MMMMSSTTRYCHAFWRIPGAHGFPVKRKEMENGKWKRLHDMHTCYIVVAYIPCVFAKDWIWDSFPVRLAVILYKTIFIANRLLSYMLSI
jgi:hypothetical protein